MSKYFTLIREFKIHKNHILLFCCLVQIILMMPWTISRIFNNFFPYKIAGISLITSTTIISIFIFIICEVIFKKNYLYNIHIFKILLLIWVIILIISSLINPIADVIVEGQGILLFYINIILFSLGGYIFKNKRKYLLLVTVSSTAIMVAIIIYFIITNSVLSDYNLIYSDVRFESIYNSSVLIPIFSVALSLLFLQHSIIYRLVGLLFSIIALSALILAGSRGTILSFIIIIFSFIILNRKMIIKIFRNISFLKFKYINSLIVILLLFGTIFVFKNFSASVESFLNRHNRTESNEIRVIEMKKELNLFFQSPIWGNGYGILHKFKLPKYNKDLYGHNYLTANLARLGLFGITIGTYIIVILILNLWQLKKMKQIFYYNIGILTLIGFLILNITSNFTYFQILGFYGSIFGITMSSLYKGEEDN